MENQHITVKIYQNKLNIILKVELFVYKYQERGSITNPLQNWCYG